MRMSRLFLRTLRDDPADAEVDSHRLLVRGGYIHRVASGIYAWLPLGRRVLRRVEQIVREEMDAAGAQELTLPVLQPLEPWVRSGRDEAYGPLMFRLEDRKGAPFCLSPTAEELVTLLVGAEYSSYRDLPVTVYQINWKYRDELRARFGLLRAREFLMKDAYSFDRDAGGLRESYDAMHAAYRHVFERCGLTFRAVDAETGEMGGSVSQEFMARAAVGEDDFVWCPACEYAANVEAAARRPPEPVEPATGGPAMVAVATPGLAAIDPVAAHLAVGPAALLKCLAVDVAGALVLALVPGDREVRLAALERAFAPEPVRVYDDDDFAAHPDLPKGYIGPQHPGVATVVADPLVGARPAWITGADRVDAHVRHAVVGRDFRVDRWVELAGVVAGDPCPRCGSPLRIDRGIEVGQVFQLGTKYTDPLDVRFTDADGAQHPMVMGCYGIGISRVVAAVAEQHHDDAGLAWPAAVSPFDLHLVSLGGDATATADALEAELRGAGLEVLYDDRDARPGVKFADADLIGIPVQLVVGAKGLARGVVERKLRATGARDELALAEVVRAVRDRS